MCFSFFLFPFIFLTFCFFRYAIIPGHRGFFKEVRFIRTSLGDTQSVPHRRHPADYLGYDRSRHQTISSLLHSLSAKSWIRSGSYFRDMPLSLAPRERGSPYFSYSILPHFPESFGNCCSKSSSAESVENRFENDQFSPDPALAHFKHILANKLGVVNPTFSGLI